MTAWMRSYGADADTLSKDTSKRFRHLGPGDGAAVPGGRRGAGVPSAEPDRPPTEGLALIATAVR